MDQQKLWKKKAYDIEEDDDLEGTGTFVEQDLDFTRLFSFDHISAFERKDVMAHANTLQHRGGKHFIAY